MRQELIITEDRLKIKYHDDEEFKKDYDLAETEHKQKRID